MKYSLLQLALSLVLLILSRSYSVGQTSRIVLPNGLHVVVAERHTIPLVAVDLWVRAGSSEERPEENGCAHFLEHTLFKGTTTKGVGDADAAIEKLGGELNAATGADYAHYYTEVPSSRLSEAIAILADIVRNATFPDAEVERERGVILAELARHDTDNSALILDGLYARAFPGLPYANSPGGRPESIKIRARDTLVSFYRRNYMPERCTLALAGDLTLEQGRTAALQALGGWRGVESTADLPSRPSTSNVPLPSELKESNGTLPAVGIAFPAPPARQADQACLGQVTAALLGNQQDGGIFGTDIWNGTEVTVRYTPRRDRSIFSIIAKLPAPLPHRPFQPSPQPAFSDIAALQAALIKQIDSLRANAPTQAALNAAIHTLLGHLQYDIETDLGLAHAIGYADLIGGENPDAFRIRLSRITPAEVQQFATAWLSPDHLLTLRSRPAQDERQP